MHLLNTAKTNHGNTLSIATETDVKQFFTDNLLTIATYTRGPSVGLDVAVVIKNQQGSSIFKLILTTDGSIWIRDMTLKAGVVSSSLIYKASCIRPSHKHAFFNSPLGKRFMYEYCNIVLVSDFGNIELDHKELIDYYLDLNEPEYFLNSAFERNICEVALELLTEGYGNPSSKALLEEGF